MIAHDFDNLARTTTATFTKDIYGTWRNFEGKRHHPESLFSFGWGDGGERADARKLRPHQEFPSDAAPPHGPRR